MSLKNPQWNIADRELYKKLFYETNYNELTEEERRFCHDMSIMEQYACGLDGDKD